ILLMAGVTIIIVALLMRRWAGRNSVTDLAVDAAWDVARRRGKGFAETDMGRHLDEVRAGSHVGRARRIAGLGIRHVIAQIVGKLALAGLLGGAGLTAAAFLLK